MKKMISLVLLFSLSSNVVFADCDWTTIKKNPDNTYTYSSTLNLCVGQLVQDNATKDRQVGDLTQAIQLKDLALKTSDDRTTLWINTSNQLEDRLQKVDELKTKNEWLFFGLGVLATGLSVYVAAKAIGH